MEVLLLAARQHASVCPPIVVNLAADERTRDYFCERVMQHRHGDSHGQYSVASVSQVADLPTCCASIGHIRGFKVTWLKFVGPQVGGVCSCCSDFKAVSMPNREQNENVA
jgi:hypothetical protein